MLYQLDIFGMRLPTFNIDGNDRIKTKLGGVFTLLIITTVLLYAIEKFSHMMARKNPLLSQMNIDSDDETINLNESGFRVAVTIEDFLPPHRIKDDGRFVQWKFRVLEKSAENGIQVRYLDYKVCDEADYAQFYPIQEQSRSLLEEIKADPNRDFYCIDWDEDEPFTIYGSEIDEVYQRLEVILMPCNSRYDDLGEMASQVSQDC